MGVGGHIIGTLDAGVFLGRWVTRPALRRYFEVDQHHIVLAALTALAHEGIVGFAKAIGPIARYGIDTEARSPALP